MISVNRSRLANFIMIYPCIRSGIGHPHTIYSLNKIQMMCVYIHYTCKPEDLVTVECLIVDTGQDIKVGLSNGKRFYNPTNIFNPVFC